MKSVLLDAQVKSERELVRNLPAVDAGVTCYQVVRRFHDEPTLHCLAVVDGENRVIGVLRSLEILRRGTEDSFHELNGRKSCQRIMDPMPLVFDVAESLLSMSKAVAGLDDRHLVDGFWVTENEKYVGIGRMTDLIRAVADQQLSLARYANPLTMLPGNVPIDQRIRMGLSAGESFIVGYFDLDNFKAYNDVY